MSPQTVENVLSRSPLYNLVEAVSGKSIITGKLKPQQRQKKADLFVSQISSGLVSLGIGGLKGPNLVGKGAFEGAGKTVKSGDFSILNWENYPSNLPKPEGPFRLVKGGEYEAAGKAANQANKAMHSADSSLRGMHIHEIQPVKFGRSPTQISNKIPLKPSQHAKATAWLR